MKTPKAGSKNWYLLRDAILGTSSYLESKNKIKTNTCEFYTILPENLKRHEIGQLIFKALEKNNPRKLHTAAIALAGNVENVWLYLEKA